VALPGLPPFAITVVGMIGLPVRVVVCLASLALLAACSSSKPAAVVTVTVAPSSAAGRSAPATARPSTSTPVTPPTPTHQSELKGTCDTLLPDAAINTAIGGTPLSGVDAFIVGTPDPTIGRVAYLNCRYGVTGADSAATPSIEIGISLYATAAKAAARITATVDDYTAHGAAASDVTVQGLPATMLTGGAGDGYDVPLLVIAFGQRTIAVSVDGSVATGDKAISDATALASLALARTGR
jgi:hypothetical protein